MTEKTPRKTLYESISGPKSDKNNRPPKRDSAPSTSSEKDKGIDMRRAALAIIEAVFDHGQMLDAAQRTEGKDLDARDQAFLKQLTTLYFKKRGSLRWVIRQLMERPLPVKMIAVERLIELGIVQILFMRTADHAAVDQSVRLIGSRRNTSERNMKGLANAVLRNAIRQRDELLVGVEAETLIDLPGWLRKRWVLKMGEDTVKAIALSMRQDVTIDITVKDPTERESLAKAFDADILPTGSLRLKQATDITQLDGFAEGRWWVQDMAAAIPATLFGSLVGKHVADLCAAPGGKTMQLAAQGAKVTAIDRSSERMPRLWQNLERTKLTDSVDPLVQDIMEWKANKAITHILLDAPCSATGTMRRNPDGPWLKSVKQIRELTVMQSNMLDHVFAQLPEGGKLIYCVCSLEDEEGPDQISAFLERTQNAKLIPITSDEVGGMDALCTEDGYLRCRPDFLAEQGGMDGFFAARIDKITSSN